MEQGHPGQLLSGRALFEKLQKNFQPRHRDRQCLPKQDQKQAPEYNLVFSLLPYALMELVDEGTAQAWHTDPDVEYIGIFTARDSDGQTTDMLYEVGALRLALQRAVQQISPHSFLDMMESFDNFAGKLASKASAAFDTPPMPIPGYGQGVFQGYGDEGADDEMERVQSRYHPKSARYKAFEPC